MRKMMAVAATAAFALGAAGCGQSKLDPPKGAGYEVVSNPRFAAGSTMERLNRARAIKVGVKFDQPGIGNKNSSTNKVEGFDIEMAKIVSGQLGISEDRIEFVETVSKNRELFIQRGTVDVVIASYSITDKRKEVVGFAGPYYQTGQDLLIRKEDQGTITGPQDLAGRKVCSVTGSTPLGKIESDYPQARTTGLATYSECVDQLESRTVDVVTTDGAILLGYAARNPTQLVVVGKPFSTEKYGIGMKRDDRAFRDFVNDSLEKAYRNGDWRKAYVATLGRSGSAAPEPPAIERY
jgi:glutamate transport system substrate-binding protein